MRGSRASICRSIVEFAVGSAFSVGCLSPGMVSISSGESFVPATLMIITPMPLKIVYSPPCFFVLNCLSRVSLHPKTFPT